MLLWPRREHFSHHDIFFCLAGWRVDDVAPTQSCRGAEAASTLFSSCKDGQSGLNDTLGSCLTSLVSKHAVDLGVVLLVCLRVRQAERESDCLRHARYVGVVCLALSLLRPLTLLLFPPMLAEERPRSPSVLRARLNKAIVRLQPTVLCIYITAAERVIMQSTHASLIHTVAFMRLCGAQWLAMLISSSPIIKASSSSLTKTDATQ